MANLKKKGVIAIVLKPVEKKGPSPVQLFISPHFFSLHQLAYASLACLNFSNTVITTALHFVAHLSINQTVYTYFHVSQELRNFRSTVGSGQKLTTYTTQK